MYMRARSSGAPGTDFPPQQPEASSGVARVAAKLLELDAAQAGVRAEEQLDLEALQRRALIEEVGLKAAQVEGLRARLAGVQARKVGCGVWGVWGCVAGSDRFPFGWVSVFGVLCCCPRVYARGTTASIDR